MRGCCVVDNESDQVKVKFCCHAILPLFPSSVICQQLPPFIPRPSCQVLVPHLRPNTILWNLYKIHFIASHFFIFSFPPVFRICSVPRFAPNLKSWEACWPHSWNHIPKPRQLHGPAPARRHLHAPFTARHSCPPPVAHPLRLLIWGHCTSCLTMSRLSWTDHRVTHCLVLLLPPDPVRVTCSRHRDFKCGPCNTIGAGIVVICLNDKKPHVLRQAPHVCHPGWPPDWPWWPEPIPTSNHHVAEKILGHLLSWSVFLLTMFWWDFGFVFLFFSCLILSRLAPPELRRARRAESGVGYNRSGGLENAGKRMINAVHLIWN